MTDPDHVRIGVLGAAAIAPQAIVDPARVHPRASVVAVAARDVRRAGEWATRHGVGIVHPTYEALLADAQIDAVYIPTPNGLHGRWTIAALEAGKHVLCEKPFAANAAEARTVADVARSKPELVVMEAFHWRYHPMALEALDLVRSGALGRIRSASGSFCIENTNRGDIRWDESLAGGALMDLGCYPLHMLRTLLGVEPTVLAARAKQRNGVDRSMEARLLFDGVPAIVRCSMYSPRPLSIGLTIHGSDGTLRLLNPVQPHKMGWTLFRPATTTTASRDGSAPSTRPIRRRADRTPTYRYQLDAFVSAVLDGAAVPTDVDDAIANMVAIDAIYAAAGMALREPTP